MTILKGALWAEGGRDGGRERARKGRREEERVCVKDGREWLGVRGAGTKREAKGSREGERRDGETESRDEERM